MIPVEQLDVSVRVTDRKGSVWKHPQRSVHWTRAIDQLMTAARQRGWARCAAPDLPARQSGHHLCWTVQRGDHTFRCLLVFQLVPEATYLGRVSAVRAR